jgi:hypothetical protein
MRGVDTFLAVKAQADLFTPVAASTLALGDFLAFNNESMSGRQQIYSSPAIRQRAMRAIAYSASGTIASEGSIEFTASNFVMNKLLDLIFHSGTGTADNVTGDGRVYTLTDGGVLTPFTTFVGFDGPEGIYTRRFTGAKVNRATLSARVDSMLTVALDIAAINKEILTGAPASPPAVLYPDGEDEYAYLFSDASVHLKAGDMTDFGEVPVESFDLTINHNLATDRYRLGSLYRRSLQESVTDVEGTFTLDAAAQALTGQKLNTAGGGTNDPAFFEKIARQGLYASLKFTVSDATRLVGSTPSGITIELPFVRLEEPDFNVRDGGIITGSARFIGYDSMTVTHVCDLGA